MPSCGHAIFSSGTKPNTEDASLHVTYVAMWRTSKWCVKFVLSSGCENSFRFHLLSFRTPLKTLCLIILKAKGSARNYWPTVAERCFMRSGKLFLTTNSYRPTDTGLSSSAVTESLEGYIQESSPTLQTIQRSNLNISLLWIELIIWLIKECFWLVYVTRDAVHAQDA